MLLSGFSAKTALLLDREPSPPPGLGPLNSLNFRCLGVHPRSVLCLNWARHLRPHAPGRPGKGGPSLGCSERKKRWRCVSGYISERRIEERLVTAMRERLTPDLVARFVERFRATVAKTQTTSTTEKTRRLKLLDEKIAKAERRIEKLAEAIAEVGVSPTLKAKLRDEEATLREARSERKDAERGGEVLKVPTPEEAVAYVADLLGTLNSDPMRGRALLARPHPRGPAELPGGGMAVGSARWRECWTSRPSSSPLERRGPAPRAGVPALEEGISPRDCPPLIDRRSGSPEVEGEGVGRSASRRPLRFRAKQRAP